jgi:tellurite methyltransferase
VSDDARPELAPPSAFFREHQARLSATASIGPTLDLACGSGRHALAAAELGLSVVALDRNPDRLAAVAAIQARIQHRCAGKIETIRVDIETPPLPPLIAASFGAVLVFRYLHRPLFPWIESLIAPGGVLLYETFTRDQRQLGWGPSRDEFLLRPGELSSLIRELVIEIDEEGPSKDEPIARTARLLAGRPR